MHGQVTEKENGWRNPSLQNIIKLPIAVKSHSRAQNGGESVSSDMMPATDYVEANEDAPDP